MALLNRDPDGQQDGIWYLSHAAQSGRRALCLRPKTIDGWPRKHYRIETAIGDNDRLVSTCAVRMRILAEGTRVVKFGLLPALRVTSVKAGEEEIPFIQEGGMKTDLSMRSFRLRRRRAA